MGCVSRKDGLKLWAVAQEGNEDARREVAAIATRVAAWEANRHRLSGEEAEDIASRHVQIVLERLDRGQSEPRIDLHKWMRWWYRSARKDYLREQKRHRRSKSVDASMATCIGSERMDSLERSELRAALSSCLDDLPSNHRQAVLLRYGNNWSTKQCNEELPTDNPDTTRVWVFRGVRALRACLEGHHIG